MAHRNQIKTLPATSSLLDAAMALSTSLSSMAKAVVESTHKSSNTSSMIWAFLFIFTSSNG